MGQSQINNCHVIRRNISGLPVRTSEWKRKKITLLTRHIHGALSSWSGNANRCKHNWVQSVKLVGTQTTPYFFGNSVAINSDGTYVAVASFSSFWVFVRTGNNTWTQQTSQITPVGGVYMVSIDVAGSTVVAIGTNAMYTFTRVGTTWTQLAASMLQPTPVPTRYYMSSLPLSSDASLLVVGDWEYNNYFGVAWLYANNGS
jgi:hypothetical protein